MAAVSAIPATTMVGWDRSTGGASSRREISNPPEKDARGKRAQQSPDLDQLMKQLEGLSLDLDYWQVYAQRVASSNPQEQLSGVRQFRLLLSLAGEIPIQAVIDTGVVPVLSDLLSRSTDSALQFEAAWALTNIASGSSEQTKSVVESGAISRFADLLNHPLEDIREQGMWGLGNVAGDCVQYRDRVLEFPGLVQRFVQACLRSTRVQTLRTGIWALSNLCRGKPRADIDVLRDLVPYLISVLTTVQDVDALSDACWALDGLSEAGSAVLAAGGAVPILIRLLDHPSVAVQRPALRVVGQVVTGDSSDTQLVMANGGLAALWRLLGSTRSCLRKDACWALSNLAAGTPEQVKSLLDSGIMADINTMLEQDPELDVRREAAWTVCNVCTVQDAFQVDYLIRVGCISAVCQALLLADERMAEVALEAISNFLRVGRRAACHGRNPCAELFKQQGLRLSLVSLQEQAQIHGNYALWKRVTKALQEWNTISDSSISSGITGPAGEGMILTCGYQLGGEAME